MEDCKKDVPYIVYESEAARHERTVKRLITALLVTMLLMASATSLSLRSMTCRSLR